VGPNATFTFVGELYTFPEFDSRVVLNEQGFHDRERALAKAPGVVRIGVFGDSMVEGWQVPVDALFTSRLEDALRADGREVEVVNLGYSGARVSTLLDPTVQDKLGEYDLDALIVTLHGAMELPFQAGGGGVGVLPAGFLGFPQSRFAKIRSAAVEKVGLDGLFLLWKKAELIAGTFGNKQEKAADLYASTADWSMAWSRLGESLGAIDTWAKGSGVKLAVAYIPAWREVQAARGGELRIDRADGTTFDYEAPRDRAKALTTEKSIVFADLSEALREPGDTHFTSDRHWKELGHERVKVALLPLAEVLTAQAHAAH
jgi:hypothetical protein